MAMMNEMEYRTIGKVLAEMCIRDRKLPEEHRPIGKYGRMHREYLREVHPARLNTLTLTGELWTYLADLKEQAQNRLDIIMEQMKAAEGVTEELKRTQQMEWVHRCNNIHNRAEDIVLLQNFVEQIKLIDSDSVVYVSTYGYSDINSRMPLHSCCFHNLLYLHFPMLYHY